MALVVARVPGEAIRTELGQSHALHMLDVIVVALSHTGFDFEALAFVHVPVRVSFTVFSHALALAVVAVPVCILFTGSS